MKTDRVLTLAEYLGACSALAKPGNLPDRDARQVPITLEEEMNPGMEAVGCRCNRWGHPCPGYRVRARQSQTPSAVCDFSDNETEVR